MADFKKTGMFKRQRAWLNPVMTLASYFEYLSFGPGPGIARKLVVLLHGYGRNAVYMQKMAEKIVALMPETAVLCPYAPEALDLSGIGQGGGHVLHVPQELKQGNIVYDPTDMRQWFAIDGGFDVLLPRLEKTAATMNDFIDSQRDIFSLIDKDIVLMGFSQGGGLALYAALTRKDELAGAVIHSSILIEKPGMAVPVQSKPPLLYIYGTADPEFSTALYQHSFQQIRNYLGGQAIEKQVAGLGHFTNAKSRAVSAAFIKDYLAP